MNRISPDKEQEFILMILDGDPELYLRDIHDKLAAMSESDFVNSPDYGDKYNDERFIVKALVEILSEKKGLIESNSGKWSLTEEGRRGLAAL